MKIKCSENVETMKIFISEVITGCFCAADNNSKTDIVEEKDNGSQSIVLEW